MTLEPAALKADVRQLLRTALYEPVGDVSDDAEIALDSLSITWLLHCVERAYGVSIRPTDEELTEFRSVNKIHAYLVRTLQAGQPHQMAGSDGR